MLPVAKETRPSGAMPKSAPAFLPLSLVSWLSAYLAGALPRRYAIPAPGQRIFEEFFVYLRVVGIVRLDYSNQIIHMACGLERVETNENQVFIIWCSIRIRHRKLFGI